MFNAPRPAQPYGGSTSNGLSASLLNDNPLAASYDGGLDPWSAAPTPSPPPLPSISTPFSSILGDAAIPTVYNKALQAVDPPDSGETSVNALLRVLGTSSLSAATIDRIVNLVSSRPRVSRQEFFIALALAALAQGGKDISIEQVASLASQDKLPSPSLRLDALPPSFSTLGSSSNDSPSSPTNRIRSPAPAYSSDDPWAPSRLTNTSAGPSTNGNGTGLGVGESVRNGASGISGTGLPPGWWKKQQGVAVTVQGQQGFILNRYTVYLISTDRGPPVTRRYSEFAYLWDCLVKRYTFRLLPALPPKRIGPDENFIEQRRRGLARFLLFVINHPVVGEDGLLTAFLTEPSFEDWRKHTSVSLDEESASKRVDRVEEMTIPSDLEEKLLMVRKKIGVLVEQWQRICILVERVVKRREAAAVRPLSALPAVLFPTHASHPSSSILISDRASIGSNSALSNSLSFSSLFSSSGNNLSSSGNNRIAASTDPQADLSRLSMTINALVEVNQHCWRGEECELCSGVNAGMSEVSKHCQRHSDNLEQRTRELMFSTLEGLKSQRDLYLAMRDLFVRHDRLAPDQVERLKKRVETFSLRLEGVKSVQREGWQEEADKIVALIERDQAAIAALLNRRVFIRYSMWHELRVVLHNRENTLLTQLGQNFALGEQRYAENANATWASLTEALENMPFE